MRQSKAILEKPPTVVRLARPAAALLLSLVGLFAVVWVCGDTLLDSAWRDFLLNESMQLSGREAPAAPTPVTVTVPNLTGRQFTVDLLPADTYTMNVTYVYDDSPACMVLGQSPAAGSLRKAVPGERPVPLSLTVSAGPRMVTVPDVQNTDGRSAEILLTEKTFSVIAVPLTPLSPGVLTSPDGQHFRYVPRGTWTDRDIARMKPGTALFTQPAAGTSIPVGSPVTLYVLDEPPTSSPICPDLIGLPEDTARARLSARGITVGHISITVTNRAAAGTVLSQGRLPGTCLSPDDRVDLEIAEAPVPHPPADPRHFWNSDNNHI